MTLVNVCCTMIGAEEFSIESIQILHLRNKVVCKHCLASKCKFTDPRRALQTVHLVAINHYLQVQMLELIRLCNPFTVSGDLRLSRGFTTSSSFTSGRLEVFVFGQWGTVCGDFWDSTNSDVACRQLGFPGAARPTSFATSSSTG